MFRAAGVGTCSVNGNMFLFSTTKRFRFLAFVKWLHILFSIVTGTLCNCVDGALSSPREGNASESEHAVHPKGKRNGKTSHLPVLPVYNTDADRDVNSAARTERFSTVCIHAIWTNVRRQGAVDSVDWSVSRQERSRRWQTWTVITRTCCQICRASWHRYADRTQHQV